EHQWPWETRGQSVEFLWSFDLMVTPDELWPWIENTSVLNRALGHPQMTYQEVDGRLEGQCRYYGWNHVFTEPPWSWIRGRKLALRRRFRRGPPRWMLLMAVIEPTDDGCRIYIRTAWFLRRMW